MRYKILEKLKKDVAEKSISQVAREIKIPRTTLHTFLQGKDGYTIRTWDKIETYYKR